MTAVPSHWRRVRLGDVLDRIEAGKSFSGEPRAARDNEWGIIKVSAMTYGQFREGENKAVPAGTQFSASAEIQPGDLLLSRANTKDYVGASVLVGACRSRLLLSDKSLRLHPTDAVDRRWLWYALSSPVARRFLSEASTGVKSGMRNISQRMLRALPLALPPIVEQRRTVEILEDHLSRLKAAELMVKDSLARVRSLESAELQAVINEESTDECSLGDVIARVEAGRSFGGAAPPALPDQWGIIKVSAMTWGVFRPEENKAVSADKADARFEIASGDLLVSRANTSAYVGASVLVGETRRRLLLSDKSLRLIPKAGVDSAWLAAVLAVPIVRRQISRRATGTKDSMRNISQTNLLSVAIPIATGEQQARVATARAALQDRSWRLESQLRLASLRSLRLRRGLLAAAFSGRLSGVRDVSEVVEEMAGV